MATSVERLLGDDPSNFHEHREFTFPPKQYAEAVVHNITNGSIDSIESGDYTGNGEAPETPMKRTHRKKPSSRDIRGQGEKQNLVEEKFSTASLMSVPKDDDYEKSLELDELERKPPGKNNDTKLVSGRQAGAGWERSG